MTGDLPIFGIFVPKALLLALTSYGALLLCKKVLARLGVYHAVWHPALFDLSIYILIFSGSAKAAQWYLT
ncbi:DUF1656 domain-containing protein [Jiella sp. MQZ9-1]|uniref:DUF1656 domain-containing protein n=1 Tax=Jiella flava TaxID=2816857 RepID=A0A939JU39_9HYPH|nr:DUF1656 domain-containing protein [Jiella flava]MBO0661024.1 DUF1656 domain-containing protein [Jiella flava]MCD2469672.1 DUF1656 domain-containing protein [Jiella flava]